MACRNLSKGQIALSELQEDNAAANLSLIQLDVTDDSSIAAAAKKLEAEHGVLDVVVSNAGVASTVPDTRQQLRDDFEANTFGPAILIDTLEPLLKKSSNPRVIHVSSGLGSIALRLTHNPHNFDARAYRLSKAALNMLAACEYVKYKDWEQGCKVWTYCPGYVVSNIGGDEERARKIKNGAKTPETSAKGVLDMVEGRRDGDVAKFVNSDGGVYPW